jgi:hypothetical protein
LDDLVTFFVSHMPKNSLALKICDPVGCQRYAISIAEMICDLADCQDMLFPLAERICGHIGCQRYAIPIAEKICDLADCQDTMFPLAGEPVIILVAKVRDSRTPNGR